MLERSELRIAPWTPAAEPYRWQRAIHADDPARRLGVVRTHERWIPFLRKIEIFETDDDALLLSLTRAWFGPAWQVRDSEGQHVGTLLPDALLDPAGFPFATRIPEPPDRWRLREPTGREYATLARSPGGVEILRFTDERLTNPFLRMMVLGGFLLLDPLPRSSRQAGGGRLD
ncbi:MAG TPA: hypothetical protein VHR72_08960 [Gemmataceae bacterium]|jgi:hypothetical protein|nr:hypothetical protein [Gemmataceae bacterium]